MFSSKHFLRKKEKFMSAMVEKWQGGCNYNGKTIVALMVVKW